VALANLGRSRLFRRPGPAKSRLRAECPPHMCHFIKRAAIDRHADGPVCFFPPNAKTKTPYWPPMNADERR